MEETKSRRVFDFTSRDVPRVDEGKKERKKERKKELSRALSRRGRSSLSSSSSSFGARSSFLLRCRSKKTPKGRGPSFFRTFFLRNFSLEKQNRERKNNMEWKKKTKRLSFCVF